MSEVPFSSRGSPLREPPLANDGRFRFAAAASGDQGTVQIQDVLDAEVLDLPLPVGAEEVEPKAVLGLIIFLKEPLAKEGPLRRVDHALEDRVLDSLAEVQAGLGDTAQAAASSRGGGGDVVADKDHHGESLPEEGWIAVEVAAQARGQQDIGRDAPVRYPKPARVPKRRGVSNLPATDRASY
jgi:hypothetical protein